jgi:hypothetical protein
MPAVDGCHCVRCRHSHVQGLVAIRLHVLVRILRIRYKDWIRIGGLKKIMKKVSFVLAIALGALLFAWSQANGSKAKKSPLDGTWDLVADACVAWEAYSGRLARPGAREHLGSADLSGFVQEGEIGNV